jgi:hypothetical protein
LNGGADLADRYLLIDNQASTDGIERRANRRVAARLILRRQYGGNTQGECKDCGERA